MEKNNFQELYQSSLAQTKNYKNQSNIIAFIRFLLMVLMIGSLLYGYFQGVHRLYILSCLLFVFFLYLIHIHKKVYKKIEYYASQSQVYLEHDLRVQHQWKTFSCSGDEYLDGDTLSQDLDVFGNCSLFQFLNVTFTNKGKNKLAEVLKEGCLQDDFKKRQQALLGLVEHRDFFYSMQTYGYMMRYQSQDFLNDIQRDLRVGKLTKFLFVLPIMMLISVVLCCFSIFQPYSYLILEIGFVSQIIFSIFFLKQHQSLFDPILKMNKSIQKYQQIFQLIYQTDFNDEYIHEIKFKLFEQSNVLEGIKELSRISSKVSNRYNIFAYVLLNGFCLYDIFLRNEYISWHQKYQKDFMIWFDELAKLEVLMSLAVVGVDGFDVTLPEIHQEMTLSFEDLRHPLIRQDKVIGNDFHIQSHTNIITGSNMSGKTTFMRTIGLNLILAYAGGFVFASQMHCSYMYILTSMRVKDNVEEGVSTFYGELLRIKQMIDYSQKGLPMICLIDEIFKGTNSLDRIAGAKATLERLSLPYNYTFLSTHDFELCHIENFKYHNYHFEEYYKDNHIYFDYLIKDGPAKSTNGQFLLKQLGIMK